MGRRFLGPTAQARPASIWQHPTSASTPTRSVLVICEVVSAIQLDGRHGGAARSVESRHDSGHGAETPRSAVGGPTLALLLLIHICRRQPREGHAGNEDLRSISYSIHRSFL